MIAVAPKQEAIQNGGFDQGDANWTGTDLETNYSEDAYLQDGSNNRVAEMDGQSGQTTVMEQSFNVANPTTTQLTFDSALRNASNGNAGSEGFTVEILDSLGNVIASMTVLPTQNSLQPYALPVTFPAAGTYTLRLTELGPDDSLGAIVDNISIMVCFAGSTDIRTTSGATPARDIRIGDMVLTERGPKPVRWIGRRQVSAEDMKANPNFRPVRITAGALGNGLPTSDLRVSRQHRMLVSSPVSRRMFGVTETLVSAIRLTGLPGIAVDEDVTEIDYIHILFDEHEVVFAEGAPSESLLLGAQARAALSPAANDEIALLFPQLDRDAMPPARLLPCGTKQASLVARIGRNARSILESYAMPGRLAS